MFSSTTPATCLCINLVCCDRFIFILLIHFSFSNLLQFPLKPVYSDICNIAAATYRPIHKTIRLEVPYDETIFAADSSIQQRNGDRPPQVLSSTLAQFNACLSVGVMKEGQLHINRVENVLQVRPYFSGVVASQEIVEDISDESSSDEDGMKDSKDNQKEKKSLQQVLLRRKENDRMENSRLHSYAHLKAQEGAEPWVPLTVNTIDSDKVADAFDALYYCE